MLSVRLRVLGGAAVTTAVVLLLGLPLVRWLNTSRLSGVRLIEAAVGLSIVLPTVTCFQRRPARLWRRRSRAEPDLPETNRTRDRRGDPPDVVKWPDMAAKTEPKGRVRHGADTPEEWLRGKGLRVTRARTAMVELLRRARTPLPLGDVHAALEKSAGEGKGCDFATVFRFLRLLETRGLVDKQPWVDGTDRFELTPDATCPGAADGAHDHHHHFLVCRGCQRTEKIEQCLVSRLQTSLGKQTGYREIAHTLQFSGLCPRCQPAAGTGKGKRRGGG